MASGLYDSGREGFLDGSYNWASNNIKVVLVHESAGGTPYTPNLATDKFLSDIVAGARIATSGNLTGKTTTAGVADADDPTFAAVSGAQVDAAVIYYDTGSAATSRLIAHIDTSNLTGLPFVPSGGDVQIQWDNGANKIFKL